MIKTTFIFFFVFYVLTLIQTSFLVHFISKTMFFNLVLIIILLINLLNFSFKEKLAAIMIGGFFLDVFSLSSYMGFFGFYMLVLLVGFMLIRIINEKYVRISFFEKKQ